jgi:hypothetical protein
MHVATAPAYRQSTEALLVKDKRGQHLKSAQHEGESLPISELGSKAIYQVCAERFVAVLPNK